MLLIRWLINTICLILVAYFVPGISFNSFYSAFIAALFLGIINATIKPLLVIFTLPINILTLGLFTFIINAVLFWFVASFIKGFEINNFSTAFWGAFVYWLIIMLSNLIIDNK